MPETRCQAGFKCAMTLVAVAATATVAVACESNAGPDMQGSSATYLMCGNLF